MLALQPVPSTAPDPQHSPVPQHFPVPIPVPEHPPLPLPGVAGGFLHLEHEDNFASPGPSLLSINIRPPLSLC